MDVHEDYVVAVLQLFHASRFIASHAPLFR